MPIDVMDPPAIYDYAYTGPLIQVELSIERVREVCVGLGAVVPPGRILYACSIARRASCFVVVPKIDYRTIDPVDQGRLIRHEQAHCNGWPMDHSTPPPREALK